MKRYRHILGIGLLAGVLLPLSAWAAVGTSAHQDWFMDNTCANNGDGLAQTCAASPGASGAFNSGAGVIWTAIVGVDDGDTLYVCGQQTQSFMAAGSSAAGIVGSQITISYDCPGNPGSMSNSTIMSEALVAASWTNEAGNIWKLSTAAYTWPSPQRIWANGTEVFPASVKANLGTNEGSGAPLAQWWYDAVNKLIYWYSPLNPAGTLSSFETLVAGSQPCAYSVLCFVNANNQYFTVINPRISGGNLSSLHILGADNITIQGTVGDPTKCTIGARASRGSVVTDQASDGSGNPADNNTIDSCTFDPVIPNTFKYYTWQWSESSASQTFGDGVAILYNAHNNHITRSVFRDWAHDAVGITANTANGTVTGNVIDFNTVSTPNVEYGRAFETSGSADGKSANNTIQFNKIDQQVIRSQINGDHQTLKGNVWTNQRQGTVNSTAVQSLDFEGFTGVVSHDHTVENETFINNQYGPCISIRNGTNTKFGITFRNIVMSNCGGTGPGGTQNNVGLFIDNAASVGAVTVQNLDIYHPTIATPVYYKTSGAVSVSAFQAACGALGDTCSANFSSDPLFVSATDYHPKPGSPLLGAGIAYTGCLDLEGNTCLSPPTIGAYQIAGAVGNVITATSCNNTSAQPHVQTAVNAAQDGDTVIIPAGTCTWTLWLDSIGGIYGPPYDASLYHKNISIKGAGAAPPFTASNPQSRSGVLSNQCAPGQTTYTCILDGLDRSLTGTPGSTYLVRQLIRWDMDQPSGAFSTFTSELANLIFVSTGIVDEFGNQGIIMVRNDNARFRVHHVAFFPAQTSAFVIGGNIQGVYDHNFCNADEAFCHYTFHSQWNPGGVGSGAYGDQSYATPVALGTANAWHIEDNVFYRSSFDASSNPYCCDGWRGARVVYRHNTFHNTVIDWHGTESGGRDRGTFQFEVYNNTFDGGPIPGSQASLIGARSGTGIITGNTINYSGGGTLNAFFDIVDYRHDANKSPVFLFCTGSNTWDQNTPGQSGYLCLDQGGTGHGDLIAEDTPVNTVLGGATWPRQSSVPIYIWNNTCNVCTAMTFSRSSNIALGRDYFESQHPTYSSYTYPHPFVGGTVTPPPPPPPPAIRTTVFF